MKHELHITSGDIVGSNLERSSIEGDVFVWHDILYDGPRGAAGWPDAETIRRRAVFLEQATGGGLKKDWIRQGMERDYVRLKAAADYKTITLWFDACLFDQAMLAHLLTCMDHAGITNAGLVCIDAFPGIEPYHGVGQLTPEQLASAREGRCPVSDEQFAFAKQVDRAFAFQDRDAFERLIHTPLCPLPWVPAAVRRWLQELPDPDTGLGRLEQAAFEAVRAGCDTPAAAYAFAAKMETPPQFWGDTTFYEKLNGLARRDPPLIRIEGPGGVLPQWENLGDIRQYKLLPAGAGVS
ncbi:MAG: hypothetical protein GF418_03045 [Chitinivibrionales bacterium]|nr:hypothetical protein [Chitinivibrionales bacterium]MBD3394579.1 hypothetical protein [Chitinivibrionales bacterium]